MMRLCTLGGQKQLKTVLVCREKKKRWSSKRDQRAAEHAVQRHNHSWSSNCFISPQNPRVSREERARVVKKKRRRRGLEMGGGYRSQKGTRDRQGRPRRRSGLIKTAEKNRKGEGVTEIQE